MNVIHVNLKVNMGMNVSIHSHYGFFFHSSNLWMKKIWIYMFLIYIISIEIMDECLILSLSYYQ